MTSTARYIEICNDLERKIISGELNGRLPGVIRLTNIYHAGQSTVKRAIAELTKKGMVTCDSTRGTFITGRRRPDNHYGIICLVGVIYDEPANSMFISQLNNTAVQHGYSLLQIADITTFNQLRPQTLANLPCDGYLVLGLTSELAVSLKQTGKSLVALNCCENTIDGVSWVDFDWEKAYRRFFAHCRKKNYRKIGVASYDNRKFNFRDRIFKYYFDNTEGDFDPDYFYCQLNAFQLHEKFGHDYQDQGGRLMAEYYAALPEVPEALLIHISVEFLHAFRKHWNKISNKPMPELFCIDKEKIPGENVMQSNYYDLYRKALELLFDDLSSNGYSPVKSALSPINIFFQ